MKVTTVIDLDKHIRTCDNHDFREMLRDILNARKKAVSEGREVTVDLADYLDGLDQIEQILDGGSL